MKHIRCGGELSPAGTYRLKNGSLRYLYVCGKCKKTFAYREEYYNGEKVMRSAGEMVKRVCTECGEEFLGRPGARTCGSESCRGKSSARAKAKIKEMKALEAEKKPGREKKDRHKPSVKDYSETCRRYRESTGKYLSYRDFQLGKY